MARKSKQKAQKTNDRKPPARTRVPDSRGPKSNSGRSRWVMRIATATIVPLLAFVLLEFGLRVAGYGYPTDYFRPSTIDGQEFLIPNETFSFRFFPKALARSSTLFRMAAQKPEGTYRIFLFGESAAFGDPDPAYGVGRYVKALLEERYPSVDFEMISVAMTAINSHAILPIARECARRDGDLWVIYMGNNEMVGPYGAGTVFGTRAPTLGRVRAILAIKTTRVGQLLDAVLTGLRGDSSAPQTWDGINMFTKTQLRRDDPGRLRAYENFEGNLDAILSEGHQAGVPIVLSTVASNLKDCSPFTSLHAPDLDAAQLSAWDKLYQEGMELEKKGEYQAALDVYATASAIDSEFAELQFRIGTCHLALDNVDEAREAFELARDHDALVIRADSRINEILTEGPARLADANVVLVDAATALADPTPERIPGQALFYEHVHLTLEGNYRLARLLAEAVAGLLPSSIAEQGGDGWATAETCHNRLAATLWDQQRMWREFVRRTSQVPYTSQSSYKKNMLYREARLKAVLSRIRPETPEQDRQLYVEAIARAPDDVLLHGNFAQFLDVTKSGAEAIVAGKRVCELLPDLSWPHCYVGMLLASEGRLIEAVGYFERALEIRSDSVQARAGLNKIQALYP